MYMYLKASSLRLRYAEYKRRQKQNDQRKTVKHQRKFSLLLLLSLGVNRPQGAERGRESENKLTNIKEILRFISVWIALKAARSVFD